MPRLLWRVRFALHIELKRYDNRLTFAHQVQVARHLGYFGEGNRGIEMMMKEFSAPCVVAELNKMLLKIFDKAILNNGEEAEAVIIDDDFQRRGNMIEARKPALFQARPETILDMFCTWPATPPSNRLHQPPCANYARLVAD